MGQIQSEEDAQFVASKIRDGTLTGERKERAFQMLEAYKSGGSISAPDVPEEKKGFFERFGADLESRFGEGKEIIGDLMSGKTSQAGAFLDMAGKVGAGTVLDFVGEVMVSGGRGLAEIGNAGLNAWTGGKGDATWKSLKEGATAAGIALLNTDVGKKGVEAATKGVAAWQEFKEEEPIMARHVEAVVNVGLLAAPVKGKPSTKVGTAGNRIIRSGERAAARNQDDFVRELVTPRQTFKERVAQVSRTSEQGINRQKTVSLDPLQQRSAAAIRKIPTISPKKTLQGNYSAMASAVTRSSRQLEKSLRGKRYDWQTFARELQDTVGLNIKKSLVGDERKAAELLLSRAMDLTAKKPKTLNNILKARRELDNWVLKHKRNAFDSPNATAMTNAVREVRAQMNGFINARVPGGRVNKSLNFQSSVLRAMDDVAEKAALEWDTVLKRVFQNAVKVIPVRNEMVAAFSLITGVGGLGAAALAMPFVQKALVGYGLYWAGRKAVVSPATRKGLGQLVNILDKGIRSATDPVVLRQLRADRAAVLELIKSVEVDKEDE